MGSPRLAKAWFALTAVVVGVGVVLTLLGTGDVQNAAFDNRLAQAVNRFAFFTVQSNVIVGITCLLLAMNLDRSSTIFAVFRLAGVVDIALTGVVYWLALSSVHDPAGLDAVTNQIVHTIVPIMGVAGWVAFGPRGHAGLQIVRWSMLIPIGWMILTLLRGLIDEWYPYPFIHVPSLGYPRTFFNIVLVALVYLVTAFGAGALDRRLAAAGPAQDAQPSVA